MKTGTLGLVAAGALWPTLIFAHHCIRDEYDEKQFNEYAVTISNVSWVNPHVVFAGKVAQADGTFATWEFEANPPGYLKRSGFAPDAVKAGDRIRIAAYRARNGARKAEVLRITFADGHQFENMFSWDGWCAKSR